MANSKITWTDKESLVTDPTIAEINKVTDSNMNEIKSVVNENADQVIVSDTEPTSNDNEIWVDTSSNATYINQEVNIGATNPSNTPTWFKQGKNLFNKATMKSGYGFDSSGNEVVAGTQFVDNIYIYVKSNTKYTLSCSNTTNNRLVICEYKNDKTFIQRDIIQDNNTLTITTTANTNYVRVSGMLNDINNIQLEQGSTATSYEPYVRKAININGEDEYYTNDYSTAEQVIGTFLGKPLYRKVIESTTFTTSFYPVSSNIKQFVNQYGYVQRKDYTGIWQFIPSRVGSAMGISFLASNLNDGVQIDWGSSWQSDYANLFNKIVLIVEYTKTTD